MFAMSFTLTMAMAKPKGAGRKQTRMAKNIPNAQSQGAVRDLEHSSPVTSPWVWLRK